MSEWIKTGDICKVCSGKGPHLRVGEMLYCGNCDNKISEGWQDDA